MPLAASASSNGGIWALVRYQHGHLVRVDPGPDQPADLGDQGLDLPLGALEGGDGRLRARGPGRDQPLARTWAATRRAGQQPVGQGQDLRAGAVVVLQPDHPGLGEPAPEAGQVLGGGAGEGVDGLVLVADHGQVPPLPQPGLQQRLLQRVGVLVLVDREPAVLAAELLGHVLAGLEPLQHADQHVLEVDPPGPLLGPLVAPEHAREQVTGDRRGPAHGLDGRLVGGGVEAPRLGPFQLVGEVLDGGELVAPGEAALERRQHRGLGGQHLGQPAVGQPRPEVAELAEGGGMERLRLDPGEPEGGQPLAHLVGRLVGEGHHQHVPRVHGPGGDRVRHPPRDHPRLARPRPGQDAQRPHGRLDRLPLRRVQVMGQELGMHGCRVSHTPPTVPSRRPQPLPANREVDCRRGSARQLASPSPSRYEGWHRREDPYLGGEPEALQEGRPHLGSHPGALGLLGLGADRPPSRQFAGHHKLGKGFGAVDDQEVLRSNRPLGHQYRFDLAGIDVHPSDDQHVVLATGHLGHPDQRPATYAWGRVERGDVTGSVPQHRHRVPGQGGKHEFPSVTRTELAPRLGIDHLDQKMVLAHMQPGLPFDALARHPRTDHFGQAIDVQGLQRQETLDLSSHRLAPRLGAEDPGAQPELVLTDPLLAQDLTEPHGVRGRAAEDLRTQVTEKEHLAAALTRGSRDHGAAHQLSASVQAQADR